MVEQKRFFFEWGAKRRIEKYLIINMPKLKQPEFYEVMDVRIISPQEVLFAGKALSVSSKNSAGNFDILGEHANFITLIENQPITVRTLDKKTLTFNFPLAIVYTSNNKVSIYTYIQGHLGTPDPTSQS